MCDGAIDDADADLDTSTATTWYADTDADTYGDAGTTDLACVQPTGFIADDTDCDDTNAAVNPGATETTGDGLDNDCDPTTLDVAGGGTFDASDATLRITGVTAFEGFGNTIATGDFDGDGTPDVVAGAGSAGTAYTFFGPVSASTTVTSADATITGLNSGTVSYIATAVGDFDGDGIDDLWATAPFNTNGTAYLIYGPFSGSIAAASDADATVNGSASGDYLGSRMAVDVDVTDDGLLDMIVSARNNDGGAYQGGAVHIFSGGVSGTLSASSADGIIEGATANHGVGLDVGSGDFNGDGMGDVLLSSEAANATFGGAWAVFGPVTGTTSTSSADASFVGPSSSNADFGYDVLGLGDMNGDGYDEIGVGTPFVTLGASYSGALYIFDGSATMSGSFAASSADAVVAGNSANDYLGLEATALGDFDGDGNDDLMVEAAYDRTIGYNTGSAYLFLGPLSDTVATSAAFIELNGTASSGYFGSSIVPAGGDLDGDGQDDLWIGAPGLTNTTSTQGAIYLFETSSF